MTKSKGAALQPRSLGWAAAETERGQSSTVALLQSKNKAHRFLKKWGTFFNGFQIRCVLSQRTSPRQRRNVHEDSTTEPHWQLFCPPLQERDEQGRLYNKQGTGLAFPLPWVCYLLFFDPTPVLSGTQLPLPPFVFLPVDRDVSMVLYLFDLSAFAKAPNRLRVHGLVPCSCSVLGVGSAAAGAHGEEPLCISSASASSRLMWVEVY